MSSSQALTLAVSVVLLGFWFYLANVVWPPREASKGQALIVTLFGLFIIGLLVYSALLGGPICESH